MVVPKNSAHAAPSAIDKIFMNLTIRMTYPVAGSCLSGHGQGLPNFHSEAEGKR
jgi:hypothetical protein